MTPKAALKAALREQDFVVPAEKFERIADERVRRYLGMSLTDFRRAWKRGKLPDTPTVSYLKLLVGDHKR